MEYRYTELFYQNQLANGNIADFLLDERLKDV